MNISVVGMGSWGTAIANLLAKKGYKVKAWDRQKEVCDSINNNNKNPLYLTDISLADIKATINMTEALKETEVTVFAVPAAFAQNVIPELGKSASGQVIISLSKGIDTKNQQRVSQILTEKLNSKIKAVAVLSGPNHAEEVSKEIPSATVISSGDREIAKELQNIFMTPYFRVYTNVDMIGVELGGAAKNVIAIAAGISDGIGFGDNTKASLMTRGLAEMKRLGIALGANPHTFSGLSGVGDLIATCTSQHSRNRRLGEMVGKGMDLKEAQKKLHMVAEGVKTSEAITKLAAKKDIEMPITAGVYSILYKGKSSQEAVQSLMSRGATSEE